MPVFGEATSFLGDDDIRRANLEGIGRLEKLRERIDEGRSSVVHRGLKVEVSSLTDVVGLRYLEPESGFGLAHCQVAWNFRSEQWELIKGYLDVTGYGDLLEAHHAALDYILQAHEAIEKKAGSVDEIKARKAVFDLISSLKV